MIERIARAMCEADGFEWFPRSFAETANGDTPEEQREYWRDKARVAIEEMREPTDEMGNGLPDSYQPGSHSAREIYQVMIDEALR